MPTPVSTARQCLTEDAARALDDAVTVARRRSHTQTTSLHAVSSLLSLLPSSPLRDACLRSSSPLSPRAHLRALDLSVTVSLDRLPTSKSPSGEPPPVANSLMAAIKRSQANQRRHPDTYQLFQQVVQSQPQNLVVKVEMKQFILSILDDPIVSRVLAEAGFHSSDVKLAVLHPPPPRFSRGGVFNFPFAGFDSVFDDNSKRIGEIMVKKIGCKRNPLLIGASANEALCKFVEKVRTGGQSVIPAEIEGVSVISLEKELRGRDGVECKLEELRGLLGKSVGPGVVVSVGDFMVLIGDEEMRSVVLRLSESMEIYGEKLWVLGCVGSYDMYMKVLAQFPSMEKDWDLQVLPITGLVPSTGGLSPKSSLMGSFVPLGGFFPSPSEFSSQLSYTTQSARVICHKKHESEVSAALNGGSGALNRNNDYSAKLNGTIPDAKVTGIQSRGNDICFGLHLTKSSSPDIPKTVSPFVGNSHLSMNNNQSSSNYTSSNRTYLITPTSLNSLGATAPEPTLPYPIISEGSNIKSMIENHRTSPSSATSVTTDLGLGTISAPKELNCLKFDHPKSRLYSLSGAVSAELDEFSTNGSNKVSSPSFCSADVNDFKSIYRILIDKIGRQSEALVTISQTISQCKAGLGRPRGSSRRGDIWLNFIGDDKVGKRKVAEALAEIIFANRGNMISVDFGSETEVRCSNSRGKTGVDCLVEELSKNPHSVLYLENIDKADFLSRNSLSRAIRTGRLANSHQREISSNNAIFLTTSNFNKRSSYDIGHISFSEERILEAKSWQMQILVRHINDDLANTKAKGVCIVRKKEKLSANKRKLIDMNESTLDEPKQARRGSNLMLDLNLPVEEGEEDIEYGTLESDTDSESSRACLEEFIDQVDGNVFFKPFDFDALSGEVVKEIDRKLKFLMGPGFVLEIDEEVMLQVLAAVWLSEKKRVVEDWIEHVLGPSFLEAKEKYDNNINGTAIFKLVACEGLFVEEQAPGVCLPSRIIVN